MLNDVLYGETYQVFNTHTYFSVSIKISRMDIMCLQYETVSFFLPHLLVHTE